jgi:hypothetical protein
VDTPLRSASHPLFPDTLLPVVSEISPDVPEDPTSDVLNDTDPDPDDKLLPVTTDTDPPRPAPLTACPARIHTDPPSPAADFVDPAPISTSPPAPLSPVPTTTLMAPPAPDVADPLRTDTHPLLPDFDVPVLSVSVPDAPEEPTLAEDRNTAPDPELTLDPLNITSAPPTP